ncbi:hypothetical protein GCM10023310_72260 [Paenibacillus vulneris]|uniref:Ankyrin repeat domain-containing protein n=1 Tax=Paenibacillus vulneris TaxID=1133364 RepID=A0ABW3UIM9_9BACL
MKKIGVFAVGAVFGIALSATTGVFADSSNLVSGVFSDFKVKINGKDTTIESKIVNIDGSTFLPVREISNKLGYEVQFQDETISLSNDGKKYLKGDTIVQAQQPTKSEEPKQVSEGNYVKDLKLKYSKDGKLNVDLIKEAIEKKELSVNAQDESTGDSLLILAIKENNFSVYQVLKDNGVDPELTNNEGKTPLHIAVINKNSFFMSELISHFRVNAKTTDKDNKKAIDYTEKDSIDYRSLKPYSF